MSSPYTGRHRAAPVQRTRPAPKHAAARGPGHARTLRPVPASAVGLGLTFALVHTAAGMTGATHAEPLRSPTALATAPPATGVPVPTPATPSRPAPPGSPGATRPAGPPAPATSPAPWAPADERGSWPRRSVKPTPSTSSARVASSQAAAPTPTADPARAWVMPVTGVRLSSPYGMRWGQMHRGIDLAGPIGLPLKAMSSGVVTFAGQQSGYGTIVQIRYWDGTISYYGHLNSTAVAAGQAVTPGQVVGQLGNTGQSTGPHVHLEIHPGGGAAVDPAAWITHHGLAIG